MLQSLAHNFSHEAHSHTLPRAEHANARLLVHLVVNWRFMCTVLKTNHPLFGEHDDWARVCGHMDSAVPARVSLTQSIISMQDSARNPRARHDPSLRVLF